MTVALGVAESSVFMCVPWQWLIFKDEAFVFVVGVSLCFFETSWNFLCVFNVAYSSCFGSFYMFCR